MLLSSGHTDNGRRQPSCIWDSFLHAEYLCPQWAAAVTSGQVRSLHCYARPILHRDEVSRP